MLNGLANLLGEVFQYSRHALLPGGEVADILALAALASIPDRLAEHLEEEGPGELGGEEWGMRRRNAVVGEEFDLRVDLKVFEPPVFHGDKLASGSSSEDKVIERLPAAEYKSNVG